MIIDIVQHLNSPNVDLKMHCSSAINKCAINELTRDMVREAGGLEPLVHIAKDKNIRDNKPLLAAATGAIWRCSQNAANVKVLECVSCGSICQIFS